MVARGRQRLSDQSGFGLVFVIGVLAALAILASTLVMITANVQSNTAQERTRTKAFGVAEGAMDYYMSQLAGYWPKPTLTAPTFDASAFRALGQFSNAVEYPDPAVALGAFAAATSYDNDQTVNGVPNVGYDTATSPHNDANGDGRLWVVARGATNDRAASIQSQVMRVPVNTQFPTGIAVWAGGNMTSNGGGNNPKVWVETAPAGSQVSSYVGGTIDTTSVFDVSGQKSSIPITPSGPSIDSKAIPSLDNLIPQAMIDQIVDLAKTMGTYYDTTQGASIPDDKSGVCVIRVADGTSVSFGNTTPVNSLASPGILLILGPEGGSGNNIQIDMGGNREFFGVFYTDGRIYSSHGTPIFHGMLVCKSNLDMRGTPDVRYNSDVLSNLAGGWTLTVALVPNTWREIKP